MINRYLRQCEDSLTGSVFTYLLTLPTEVFWQILRASCYSNDLPTLSGEPTLIEFWPNWNPEGTNNQRYIEPDLYIRFTDFDLIIEAKRWDEKQQNANQWKAQIRAYQNEYAEEAQPPKPLHYLALGGLHSTNPEELALPLTDTPEEKSVTVTKARWETLLKEVQHYRHDLESICHPSSQQLAHLRICQHTLDLLSWHGFSIGKWFEDIKWDTYLNITYPAPLLTSFTKV